jgi:hypothetical protein
MFSTIFIFLRIILFLFQLSIFFFLLSYLFTYFFFTSSPFRFSLSLSSFFPSHPLSSHFTTSCPAQLFTSSMNLVSRAGQGIQNDPKVSSLTCKMYIKILLKCICNLMNLKSCSWNSIPYVQCTGFFTLVFEALLLYCNKTRNFAERTFSNCVFCACILEQNILLCVKLIVYYNCS